MNFMKANVDEMYKDNVYVKHYEEFVNNNFTPDVDIKTLNRKLGLEYDALAEAQYYHYVAVKSGSDKLLSIKEINLLKQHGFIAEDE